ncbi:MAG: ribonuclease HI [Planctomycetota bacterium]|nr:ribonuclease HI [Planctomycetota bacterium]
MSMDDNNALPRFELFTDGACSGNPGPGGWAYILRDLETGEENVLAGGEAKTTNNRMELTSVIEGLLELKTRSRVDLYSDSQYVVKGLNEWMDNWKKKGWKGSNRKPVKNRELWERLDEFRQQHQLVCHWVKGHNEHPENERCDRLATDAIEQLR